MMLCEKVRSALKKYSMIEKDEKLAIAFSGGADSVSLLHFFKDQGYEPSAIHVNHGIRGDEADGDEDFCRDFCKKNSIPFFAVHIDVPAEAKKRGEGLEETARKMRYAEIEKITAENGIQKVATAHHADDNMETLIFNITRGSSLKGAGAIPPVRGQYIRPLIECTREDVIEYCNIHDLEYVTDSTNLSTDYTRNFIRHEIIPKLKQINPDAANSFSRFTASARRDEDFIQSEVAKYSENTERQVLAALHPSLLTRFIYNSADKYGVVPAQKAVDQLIFALKAGNEYKSVDMGENLKAVCDRNSLRFEMSKAKDQEKQEPRALVLGKNDLGNMGHFYLSTCSETFDKVIKIYNISTHTRVNFDKIKGNLYVRHRQNGDSYRYGGITRSLKKLLNEKKLTVKERNSLPLVCDDNGIVWIPSFPIRDDLKTNSKEKILYIGYLR